MNVVIVIAVLVIIAGVVAYKKLPAFKEKVDGLLKKRVLTTVHTEPAQPATDTTRSFNPEGAFGGSATPAVNPFLRWKQDGLTIQEIIIHKLHRGLSDAERAQAEAVGYVLDAPAPVDNGPGEGVQVLDFPSGQMQTVTFSRPGTVRVIPMTQIRSLTDHVDTRSYAGTVSPYDRVISTTSYTFSVVFESASGKGKVGVQLL